jgi:hypothetical protein
MAEEQLAGQTAPDSSPDANIGLEQDQGSSTPENNVDGGSSEPKLTDRAQERFDSLTGKLKGESEARRALELELAELRGRVSQGEQASDPWAKFSDEELLGLTVQEQVSPEQKGEALRRYHQRMNSKLDSLTQDKEAQTHLQNAIDQTWGVIREEYGPDVDNRGSELYQKATDVYGEYRQKWGANTVDSDPRYQLMAFEVAHSQVSSGSGARVAELEAEIARLKQGETIEAAGNLASSGVSRTNRAVNSGDARTMAQDIAKKLLGAPPLT